MKARKRTMREYVCPACFNRLSECKCSIVDTLIHIDYNLQYAIRELNSKQYITGTCCEGHYKNPNQLVRIYISFKRFPRFPEHFDYPEGWKVDKSGYYICYDFKPKDKEEYKQVHDREIEKLNKWANSLEMGRG